MLLEVAPLVGFEITTLHWALENFLFPDVVDVSKVALEVTPVLGLVLAPVLGAEVEIHPDAPAVEGSEVLGELSLLRHLEAAAGLHALVHSCSNPVDARAVGLQGVRPHFHPLSSLEAFQPLPPGDTGTHTGDTVEFRTGCGDICGCGDHPMISSLP